MINSNPKKTMKLKVLGICAGNGVILHPFRKTEILGNIEPRTVFHTPDDIQWKLNFRSEFDKSIDVNYNSNIVDVIIGAPDCGHSSVLAYSRGKKLSDPKDNASLQLYCDSVNKYEPKFFMMENLPRMLDNMGSDLMTIFKKYRLFEFIQPVSSWGNSQMTRIRLVIVGVRKDINPKIDKFIKLPVIPRDSLKSEKELLAGLEEPNKDLCHIREPDDYEIPLYYKGRRKISVAEARRLWLTEFKVLKKWPVKEGNLNNQPGVYRNFADDFPLTVRKQNRQFNHRGEQLTPREMARIQGVPDSFKLWYDESRSLFCINKGRVTVTKSPPYEIGSWFYKVLSYSEVLL
jgi:site-specific DNA-cytosine methylase